MTKNPHQLILASAGTGKTYNLVVHFVGLLLRGVAPDKILATTFTRKAAGEILERVIEHLVEAITDEEKLAQLGAELPDVGVSKASCTRLLASLTRSLDQLKVKTLDAFFVSIAKVYALDLGLPPDWQIVDEVDAKELKSEAIARMLSGEDQAEWVQLLRQLQRAAGRRVHEAMFDTVGRFGEAFAESGPRAWITVKSSFEELSEEQLDAAVKLLVAAPGAVTAKGEENKTFAKARVKLMDALSEGRWKDFMKVGPIQKLLQGERVYARAEIPQEFCDAALPLAHHASAVLTAEVSSQNQAAFSFLEQFSEVHRDLQAEESAYRFEDLPLRLAPDLGANPLLDAAYDMWFRIDGRIDHLLLDEFQDTSPVQWRILERIISELLADGSGERSLFCVGDVKQSIYGFREAEPRVLAELPKRLPVLAEVVKNIDKSYRSSNVILETVNRVFASIGSNPAMSEEPWREAASEFEGMWEEHTSAHEGRGGAAYLLEAEAPTDGRDAWRQVVGRTVERVLDIQGEAEAARIGILVRKKGSIPSIIYRLREEGVFASGEGGNPLVDSSAVLHLLSIVHWLDHPGDSQARFHAACSSIGASLGIPERGDALEVLRTLRRRIARERFGPFCDSLMKVVMDEYSEWDQRRFAQLIDLAHAYDERAGARPRAFVEHVRNQPVEDPTAGRVKVMTIHASKGLEFDAVILPDLDGNFFPVHEPVYTLRPDPYGAIEAVSTAPSRELSLVEPTLDVLWQNHQKGGMTDVLCVLYVAMTRARSRLDIIFEHAKDREKAMGHKRPGAILRNALLSAEDSPGEGGLLWSHEASSNDWFVAKEVGEAGEAEEAPTFALAETKGTRRLPRRAPSSVGGSRSLEASLLLGSGADAAQHGTLVHSLMEGVEWLEAHDRSRSDLDASLQRLGASSAQVESAIAAFSATLEVPEIQALLAREAQQVSDGQELELYNEREFSLVLTDEEGSEYFANGSIDRFVLTTEGGAPKAALVIDFKTDRVTPEEVPARAEHHAPQMRAYRRAVSAMYGLAPEDVKLKLAFLTPGVVHEVD
ncbi:MAG: UvrD-helicase domain-containing protein [Planctomycetes bacterium]|nr:UvrD-helicase domain-containing protein [Planctomycetota bacterium]